MLERQLRLAEHRQAVHSNSHALRGGGDSVPAPLGNRVRVTAGDVLPLLAHAAQSNRAWLADFLDEPLDISPDLYEVLIAYRRLCLERRPEGFRVDSPPARRAA